MNHKASQMPSAATTLVYLLQVDPSISLSSSGQVLPLHLLDNSLEYRCNQNADQSALIGDALPISTKLKEEQDHVQIMIDSCQESKIMGFLVSETCQNVQNQPISYIEPQISSIVECTNTELTNIDKSRHIQDLNVTVEDKINTNLIQDYVHIRDRIVPPRALAVLPSVLKVQRRHIISARRTVPFRARFGPVQGIKSNISQSEAVELVLNANSNKKALFLVKDDNNLITHIDVSDVDKSNWISLLPLGTQDSANVWLFEENQELYAITTEIIPSRRPLMLGYSKLYADTYGLDGPTKEIQNVPFEQCKQWWCHECQRTMPSANLLRRHTDMYHKEGKQVSRKKYRCKYCSRTFSTIFTLRRHVNLHCTNKSEKRNNVVIAEAEAEPQINLNSSICHEDNRISSDESFQNYSNGLDFSTNLFDTDRIPNLDISGNSRSDNDFNPYAIGYRDENGLTNELDVPNIIENSQGSSKEKKSKPVDQFLVTCTYCNQIVVKEKRRLHVSECPGRRFECECKKVFTNKSKLAQHIYDHHTSNAENDKGDSKASTNPEIPTLSYKCEQCQYTFKRRGMLVNHLWRVHKTVSTRVPLERRVRHYPCVVCPKIYRTAAKRDRHVLLHHPGSEKLSKQALEGGTRVCEPAMCSACPRQYATRAKLLQHQRAQHPFLAPPLPTKNSRAT